MHNVRVILGIQGPFLQDWVPVGIDTAAASLEEGLGNTLRRPPFVEPAAELPLEHKDDVLRRTVSVLGDDHVNLPPARGRTDPGAAG